MFTIQDCAISAGSENDEFSGTVKGQNDT